MAADRDGVGEDHVVLVEDGDGGGAAAHVDHRGAELQLVLHQGGEARGIGRDHEGGRLQVTALDAGGDVAHGARRGGDDVHVHAEVVAEHAARIADAAVAVDRIAGGDRVDHLPAAVVVLEIGRAHVCTPGTNAPLVCRLLL